MNSAPCRLWLHTVDVHVRQDAAGKYVSSVVLISIAFSPVKPSLAARCEIVLN